jgi:hypothetical protein
LILGCLALSELARDLRGGNHLATAELIPAERAAAAAADVDTNSAAERRRAIAMLDSRGIVVSWYDLADADDVAANPVLDRHVSQFCVSADIASGLPRRARPARRCR